MRHCRFCLFSSCSPFRFSRPDVLSTPLALTQLFHCLSLLTSSRYFVTFHPTISTCNCLPHSLPLQQSLRPPCRLFLSREMSRQTSFRSLVSQLVSTPLVPGKLLNAQISLSRC